MLRRRDLEELRKDIKADVRAVMILLAEVDSKLAGLLYHFGLEDEEDSDNG